MNDPATTELKTKSVDAVVRALRILKIFDHGAPELSLAEISRRTGFVKSTCMRMLLSLAEEGLISVTPERRYTLGPEVYRLGKCYSGGFRLESHVRPVMKSLVAETNECVSFFQRVGNRRMCLFREDSEQVLREHVAEGDTVTLDRGAAGRVLMQFARVDAMQAAPAEVLADLPFVSIGERDSEIAGVSAPVFSNAAGLVGAIAISGPLSRLTPDRIAVLAPRISDAAILLSHRLGARFYG